MDIGSKIAEYLLTGIIGAIVGAIFGASGLLFFPLKRYMEKKLQKAENDAMERIKYQKEEFALSSQERDMLTEYVLWLRETLDFLLTSGILSANNEMISYWKKHLNECDEKLRQIQNKRKDMEREQIAESYIENIK